MTVCGRARRDAADVEAVLESDAAGVFSVMAPSTKRAYLDKVRSLADWSGRTPVEVARRAVESAAARGKKGEPAAHVGHVLLGAGRRAFEKELGVRRPIGAALASFAHEHSALVCYAIMFALLAAGIAALDRIGHGEPLWFRLTNDLLLFPLAFITANLVFIFLTKAFARSPSTQHHLAQLAFDEQIIERYPTLVTSPVLIASRRDVGSILRNVEANYVALRNRWLRFAILTDFADAAEENMPGDDQLLEQLREGVAALNRRYPSEAGPRFLHFHRRRVWNPVERKWMGWERKRGKLVEFDRLVLGREDTSYVDDDAARARVAGTKYILTLDADSLCGPRTAEKLVATAAHPLNQPLFSEDGSRLVRGHALYTGRLVTLPSRSNGERHLKRDFPDLDFMFQDARDDTFASTQAAFGHGWFYGKGLYDVEALERAMEGRIPENFVLSHDHLDSAFGRAGEVEHAMLLESDPETFTSMWTRMHRWMRGDLQSLPWMTPFVPTENGKWRLNDLPLYHRLVLANKIFTCFAAPWFFGWIVLMWARPSVAPSWAFTLGAFAVALMFRFPVKMLPSLVLVQGDAIVRSMYRMLVSRRLLLEWTPMAHARRGSRSAPWWARSESIPLVMISIGALLAFVHVKSLLGSAPLLIYWTATPFFDRRMEARAEALKAAVVGRGARPRVLACRIWHERLLGERHLDGDASPRDLATAMLARASAMHFGYCTRREYVDAIAALVASTPTDLGVHGAASCDGRCVLRAALLAVERTLRNPISEDEERARWWRGLEDTVHVFAPNAPPLAPEAPKTDQLDSALSPLRAWLADESDPRLAPIEAQLARFEAAWPSDADRSALADEVRERIEALAKVDGCSSNVHRFVEAALAGARHLPSVDEWKTRSQSEILDRVAGALLLYVPPKTPLEEDTFAALEALEPSSLGRVVGMVLRPQTCDEHLDAMEAAIAGADDAASALEWRLALCALDDFGNEEVLQKLFHEHPRIKHAEFMLYEKRKAAEATAPQRQSSAQ